MAQLPTRRYRRYASLAGVAAGLTFAAPSATAVSIELKDAGPDRIERQRAAAEGRLPLPDTPDTGQLRMRLDVKGLHLGDPIFVRIFKAQSELEVWVAKDGAFVHFATYPVCHWSGTLGPKLRRGDKQAPEGFYTITRRQLHLAGRWPRALNLGYPNVFDRSQTRSGSHILIHGGCSSVGCFAMTSPVNEEIYKLTEAALRRGQQHVPVHVFPFRMTEENVQRYSSSTWKDFWLNLKEGHDLFEQTHRPPRVSVCEGRYQFEVSSAAIEGGEVGPLGMCRQTAEQVEALDRLAQLVPAHVVQRLWADARSGTGLTSNLAASSLQALSRISQPEERTGDFNTPRRHLAGMTGGRRFACSPSLASCRKFMALAAKRAYAANRGGKKRLRTAAR